MLAIGGLLAGTALLAIVILTPVFRRPDAPRWVTYPLVGELVTVAIVSVLALGIGFVGAGAIRMWQEGFDLVQIGLFAASLAAVIVTWRWLNARTAVPTEGAANDRAAGTLAAAGITTAANEAGAPTPPERPQPRRRAA